MCILFYYHTKPLFIIYSLLKQKSIFWPFQEVGGGDEACAGCVAGQFLGLPPEGVCLVHNLQDVTFPEAHTGVSAGDGRILLGAVVSHGPHVELTDEVVYYDDM